MHSSSAISVTGLPVPISSTAWALNSAVYRWRSFVFIRANRRSRLIVEAGGPQNLAHLSLRCAGFRCSNSFYQLSEMQTTSRLLLLALTLVFSGCAQDVANRYYASERYPAKDVNDVNLLYSAPSREFTVIADFQSRNESPQGMRIRAAKIGADAIIITPSGGSYRLNEQWAGNDSMSHSYSRLVGSVIKYRK